MSLTDELRAVLIEQGADLVGFADMEGVTNCHFPKGVAVAMALPPSIVRDLKEHPTREYHEAYNSINEQLNRIVHAGERFLQGRGYEAFAQTTGRVVCDDNKTSPLPHKTVATRAGLGWIGKSCLLVTREFGSAVRISSLLTDADLDVGEPVLESRCGTCDLCVRQCLAQALTGMLWSAGVDRAVIVDAFRCDDQMAHIAERWELPMNLCGRCIAVCGQTQRYLADPKETVLAGFEPLSQQFVEL